MTMRYCNHVHLFRFCRTCGSQISHGECPRHPGPTYDGYSGHRDVSPEEDRLLRQAADLAVADEEVM